MKAIGKYRLVAEVGHGGMADVYLALAPGPNGFNKTVVVKQLRGEAPDEQAVAMFLDEARIAARLNHPNVVQTYEVGYAEGGRPFLAMEFVEGQSLQSLLRRAKRNLPLSVFLRVLGDVLAALEHAHELCDFDGRPLGIVHRDVTPHNVIVSYDGHGKLLDFGIAKANVRSAQTQTGMLKGKVSYMSPEQANGGAIDLRSDLFSVGVMLYQVVTGLRFWGDEQDMPILVKLAGGLLPDLEVGLANVPAPLAAIVRRAVSVSPSDRYGSASEFQADLERCSSSLGPAAPRREVGAYVSSLFKAERASLREVIDRHSRAHDWANSSREMPESELPQLRLSGALPLPGDGSGSLPQASLTGALLPAAAPPSPPAGRAKVGLRVATVVACVAVIGAGAYMRPRKVRPSPAAFGGPAVAPEAEAPPPAAKAPAPPKVTLTIEAKPPHARLFVDDRPLDTNPAAVPLAPGAHEVRAEAEGFAAASQAVSPSDGESITLTLRPLKARAAQAAPPGHAAAPAGHAAPAQAGHGAQAPHPPPAQRENASTSAAKGADLAGF